MHELYWAWEITQLLLPLPFYDIPASITICYISRFKSCKRRMNWATKWGKLQGLISLCGNLSKETEASRTPKSIFGRSDLMGCIQSILKTTAICFVTTCFWGKESMSSLVVSPLFLFLRNFSRRWFHVVQYCKYWPSTLWGFTSWNFIMITSHPGEILFWKMIWRELKWKKEKNSSAYY